MPEMTVAGMTSPERTMSSRKAETGRRAEAEVGAGAEAQAEAEETTSAPIRATATAILIDAQSDIETADLGLLKTQENGIEDEENGPLGKETTVADIAIFLTKRPVNLLPPRTKTTILTLIHSTTLLARHHFQSRPFVAVGAAILRPCPALIVALRLTMTPKST